MPQPNKRAKGSNGESLAAAALVKAGYQIVTRNWRCAAGEIDIVARHRGDLVFVEVLARSAEGGGIDAALESITPRKQKKLMTLAQAFLNSHNLGDIPFRFDAVAVRFGQKGVSVQIIEDAVEW